MKNRNRENKAPFCKITLVMPTRLFLRSRRLLQARPVSLGGALRKVQLSYFSNRYRPQRSNWRVSSRDEHYSKQAVASDKTARAPRRTHNWISARI